MGAAALSDADGDDALVVVSNPISGEVGAAAWSSGVMSSASVLPVSNPISGELGAAASGARHDRRRGRAVSNPISGEVGAAACKRLQAIILSSEFQTPSAGRWELQPSMLARENIILIVSNPISGEVGAAADVLLISDGVGDIKFQTPSAGSWELQPPRVGFSMKTAQSFQTPSAGKWVLQLRVHPHVHGYRQDVSNPISGEVGAAAGPDGLARGRHHGHVSNPISGEVGAAAHPAQQHPWPFPSVSNPISGEVGAAAGLSTSRTSSSFFWFQTPSAGRWVLQPMALFKDIVDPAVVSNPISGEVGAAAELAVEIVMEHEDLFQTPSAGRLVLQRGPTRWVQGR